MHSCETSEMRIRKRGKTHTVSYEWNEIAHCLSMVCSLFSSWSSYFFFSTINLICVGAFIFYIYRFFIIYYAYAVLEVSCPLSEHSLLLLFTWWSISLFSLVNCRELLAFELCCHGEVSWNDVSNFIEIQLPKIARQINGSILRTKQCVEL